ncbi:transcriptional regulator BolA [Thaumasiovibrio sp. DFM-14]|uniref:transcriptional regulator BolA n=1 Tax=Thaumasiovibrio sp. DFM-14 TaxID=3384792 RepID=UPI0039A1FE57
MIKEKIEQKLLDAFTPSHLEVVNESYMHNVPAGAESHFKVIVVSDDFHGKKLLQRHRAINEVLAHELSERIHALAIHSYTGNEWKNLYDGARNSPSCKGGVRFGS